MSKTNKKNSGSVLKYVFGIIGICFLVLMVGAMIPAKRLMEKGDDATVIKINDHKVTVEDFRYYMNGMLDSYKQAFGDDYFETDEKGNAFNYVKAYVATYLKEIITQYDWGIELGYKDDETIEELAKKEIEKQKATLGIEEFNKRLEKNEISEEAYFKIVRRERFIDNFMTEINDYKTSIFVPKQEEIAQGIIDYGIFGFKDIFFWSSEDEQEDAKQKEKCEKAYERLLAGEDYDSLMFELSENKAALDSNPEGYTINQESLNDEVVYKILMQIEVGENSGVVHSDSGYHIIKKVEPNIDDAKILIVDSVIEKEFAQRYSQMKSTNSAGYDDINYDDFKKD